jgi:aspartate-semialdehyde dehydrogenase
MHFVFFAATGALSKTLAPEAARRGAVAIDKSSTWRMAPDVPLVIPEINAGALDGHRGIVACPNCTTIGAAMALAPIRQVAGLRSVVITTLQAASGAGREAIDELSQQERDQIAGREPEAHVFPRPLAGNALPMCERFEPDGYTSEERKLLVETRKIFQEPALRVSMTCVRVPVVVGHSATLLIETVRPLGIQEARAALAQFIERLARVGVTQPHFPAIWLREMADGGRHLDRSVIGEMQRVVATLTAILDDGRRERRFRPVDPFVIHLNIVAPLLFFTATASMRSRFRTVGPAAVDIPAGDLIAHVQQATLAAVEAEAAPAARGRRRKRR